VRFELDTRRARAQPGEVDRPELRTWIEDALARHDRDAGERAEAASNVTVEEILDAVWGRLPLDVRRRTSRAQVQASLTMITLRRGVAMAREQPHETTDIPGIER
jgi:hypothetical protein